MKCRSLPFLFFLFWMLSGITLKGQSFQIGYRALTADFDPTIRFAPYNDDIPVVSGVGVHVLFPYTKYFAVGGDARVGKMNNIDSEVTNLRAEDLFTQASLIARVQNYRRGKWFKPFFQAGAGIQNLRKETRWSPSISIGAGLDIELVRGLALGFSSQYTRELSRNRYFMEYALGLTGTFGQIVSEEEVLLELLVDDKDGDGIPNDQDHCPEVSGAVFTNGCPDQDEDGVADIYDECPTEPGLASYQGCPLSTVDRTDLVDSEKEDELNIEETTEVKDTSSVITNLPSPSETNIIETTQIDSSSEDTPIIAQENPAGLSEADYDRDNIPDRLDECPEVFGKLELNGCPEPDRDNDGVIDKEDRCPDVSGSLYNQGCPDDVIVANEKKENTLDNEEVNTAQENENSGELTVNQEKQKLPEDQEESKDQQGVTASEILANQERAKDNQRKTDDVSNPEVDQDDRTNDRTIVKTSVSDENQDSNASDTDLLEKSDVLVTTDDTDPPADNDSDISTTVLSDNNNEDAPKRVEAAPDPSINKVDTVVIIKTEEKIRTVVQEKVVRIDDNDGDGIANSIDRCPDLFGSIKNEGCPEKNTTITSEKTTNNVVVQPEQNTNVILSNPGISSKERFAISPMIHFQQGVATLQSQYVDELEEIAAFMRVNPEYNLKIYGHTDSKGADYINQILSERRAKTCYLFLHLTAKIPKHRMSYHGEGEYAPISDNYTSQGRWKNRRVVFDFIRR